MRIYFLAFLFIAYLLAACTSAPREDASAPNAFNDTTLQRIYRFADKRDAQNLLPYFENQTAAYRMAAARCAASMTDSLFVEPITKLLTDPVPYVRLHAAFASGQYHNESWLPALEKAIKKASIPEIKAEILTAVGKCSNRQATEYLVFHEPSTAIEEAGKLWGIYHATLRGNLRKDDLRIVVAHLNSKERETKLAAAHILSRQKEFSLNDFKKEIYEALKTEENGEVRAVLTRSLKQIDDSEEFLETLAQKDSDPRVRAEAIRNFTFPLRGDAEKIILQSLEDGSVWVAMTAATALSNSNISTEQLSRVNFLLETSPIPEVRAAIAGKIIASEQPETGWFYWSNLSNSNIEKAIAVNFLPMKKAVADTLEKYALLDNPLGTACYEKITSWHSISNFDIKNWFKLSNAVFAKNLIAQSFIASQALLEMDALGTLDTSAVLSCYESFVEEGQAESRNSLRRLISNKLDLTVPAIQLLGHREIDWEFVQKIPKKTRAELYTPDGNLSISLLIEDAPGSVSNFIHYANAGNYDNTLFHRIVPVFVSQGGGPRGDGYGSTKYSLRSEFSNLHFGPGVVGLASAGKDTESCQFFITHLSTPHLDGRYTIIGAVNDGMKNLDKIKSGTRIDSIRINM